MSTIDRRLDSRTRETHDGSVRVATCRSIRRSSSESRESLRPALNLQRDTGVRSESRATSSELRYRLRGWNSYDFRRLDVSIVALTNDDLCRKYKRKGQVAVGISCMPQPARRGVRPYDRPGSRRAAGRGAGKADDPEQRRSRQGSGAGSLERTLVRLRSHAGSVKLTTQLVFPMVWIFR